MVDSISGFHSEFFMHDPKSFQYGEVWMTLIGHPPVLQPDDYVQLLAQQGIEPQFRWERTDAELPWRSVQIEEPDQGTLIEGNLYAGSDAFVHDFLQCLANQVLPDSAPDGQALRQRILGTQAIAQTIKRSGDFERGAELEYMIQCGFAQPPELVEEPKDQQSQGWDSLWLFHTGNQWALADPSSSDPSDILFRDSATVYNRLYGVEPSGPE